MNEGVIHIRFKSDFVVDFPPSQLCEAVFMFAIIEFSLREPYFLVLELISIFENCIIWNLVCRIILCLYTCNIYIVLN